MRLTLFAGAMLLCVAAVASDEPGQRFVVEADRLPKPFATPASDNGGNMIARHQG